MTDETTGEAAQAGEPGQETPRDWDPRPATQIEAEEGARDTDDPGYDPRLRAADIASAQAYAKDGIMGAPGSELGWEGDPPEVPATEGVRPASQIEAEDARPEETTGEDAEAGEPQK